MTKPFVRSSRDARGVRLVVVESPRGSTAKLAYDPELEAFTLSRMLPLGLSYPYDWGYVPGTRAPDGDPLDALVVYDGGSLTGCVLRVRPLGVVRLSQKSKPEDAAGDPTGHADRRERNDRVVFTLHDEPRYEAWKTAADMPDRLRDEIEAFLRFVVAFEGKDLVMLGWGDAVEAESLLDKYERGSR